MENVRCMSRYNYVAIQTRDWRLKFSSLMGYWLRNWWSDYGCSFAIKWWFKQRVIIVTKLRYIYIGNGNGTCNRVKPCLLHVKRRNEERNVHKVASIKRISPEEFKLRDLRFSWRFHLSPASRPKHFPRLSSPPRIYLEYRIYVHHDLRRDRTKGDETYNLAFKTRIVSRFRFIFQTVSKTF